MSTGESLNPWRLSGFKPGQVIVCRIRQAEPGGYIVFIPNGHHTGFLQTQVNHQIDEELFAEFVRVESDRLLLCPYKNRPKTAIDRTKCRELDGKIFASTTLEDAQLTATQILAEINWRQDNRSQVEGIMAALVLNTGRFCVQGESPLRRIRDMLNTDVEYLSSVLRRESDEYQMFSEFQRAEDQLGLMNKLSDELSTIVQWPAHGSRMRSK